MFRIRRKTTGWPRATLLSSVLLAALVLLPVAVFAADPAPKATTRPEGSISGDRPAWPHALSDLQPDPDLLFGRLPNGFRYVLMPNTEPRDRVSLHLNVQVGSLHERDDQRGLAHFLEHLMFNGSTHFPPGELVKYFQKIGMQFGPDANAHTGFQETVYDILLPDGKPASLEKGLLVLSDYAQGALLLPAEVAREREVILAEMRERDTTSYRILDASFQFEFAGTRVAQRLPIGLEAVVRSADAEDFKAFYDTWYRPGTMVLVMVGDINAQTVVPMIEKYFGNLTARAPLPPAPEMGQLNHQGVKTFFHHEREAGKTTVSIGNLRQQPPKPDSVASQREFAVQHLADRIIQQRMDRAIVQGQVAATSARIGSGLYLGQFHYGEISAECDPENWAAALTFLEQSLRQALIHGFTSGELERVKKDFLADLDVAVSKAATRDSQALARNIIWHLNNGRVLQSPRQRQALLKPFVAALTLEDVHQALKGVWPGRQRLVSVTGNAVIDADDMEPAQAILAVYNQSGQVAVSKPQVAENVVFPYLPAPTASGAIRSNITHPDLGITQIRFANGVYLNFKQTDFKANEVRATLSFGAGRVSQPASQPGLAELSEAVVNASGVGPLDKEALRMALAGTNTEVTFRVAEDRFVFEGYTVTQNVERLFQLLYAHLEDPVFRKEALALSAKRLQQQFEAYSGSVEGHLRLNGFRFLAGGDSRFGFPHPSEWQALKLAHVADWIGKALAQAPLELSIVGDCDPQTIIELAARYFGTLASRPAWTRYSTSSGPRFPYSQAREFKVTTKIPKGLVAVVYGTADFWDIQRTRRLAVLADVLSDRLRIGIRDEKGASYSPFAFNRSSRAYTGYGFLQTYIQVAPESTASIVRAVKDIVADMTTQGITDEELRRAKDPILTGLKDLRRSNSYWLDSVLAGSSRHPQQLDWSRTILDDYAAVTAAELMTLAHTYLQNDKAAVMTFIPAAD